ncbi:MAG: TonB-dependent receptor [Flavobacteriales bacterium]
MFWRSRIWSMCAAWMPLITLAQTLTGTVQDLHGRPLADVYCVVGEEATLTNSEGFFSLSPRSTSVTLKVSHLGFVQQSLELDVPQFGCTVVLEEAQMQLPPAFVQTASDQPHQATVTHIRELNVKELDVVPATSRIQALKSVAGVHLMTAGAGMMRPVMRGLSGLRVGTTFLGARVESQAWAEGHGIFFPEQGVSRMDVVRGPEVLLYGPDAFGGVLNVVPTGPLAEEGRLSQLSFTSHSNTGGFQGSWMTQKRSAKAHHVLLSGVNRFGEYQLPSKDRVAGSALRQFYSQGRFGYIREWGTWEGAYSSCYNTAGLIGAGGTQQSGDHLVTAGAHVRWGGWEVHPSASYQLNHRKELAEVTPDSLNEEQALKHTDLDLSLRSTRIDIRAHKASEDGGWEWTLGSQGFSKTNLNDTLYVNATSSLIPDAAIQGGGVFVRTSKPGSRLRPSASVRGDLHRVAWEARPGLMDASQALKTGGERHYGMLSGALGVLLDVNVSHRLGVHALRGNRAPGLAELLAHGSLRDNYREEWGDPDLGLETSHTAEIQWVKSSEAPHGWTGDAAVYVSDIQNYMMLVPSGEENEEGFPIQLHQATRASLLGADVNAVWVPRWAAMWSLHTALSVVHSRDAGGEALPWTPPATGRWELRHSWANVKEASGMASIVVEASRDAVLLHASTSWSLGTRTTLNAQVINVTNQSYVPTLSLLRNLGIAEPGRNVRLQVVYAW